MDRELDTYLAFAHRLADASGAVLRRAYRQPQAITVKSDESPVTETDKAVEKAIRDLIEAVFPDHGIIGEELGELRADAEFVWVLDPIDGTKAFLAGIPVFGTLIALARDGVPVLGVIDQPNSAERWIGADGVPTTLNGRPIQVRACPDLADAMICTASPEYYEGEDLAAFERLRAAVKWAVYGGSCYAHGLLAGGSVDLGLEAQVEPFDYCALVPIIRNAGGVATDWDGNPITIRSGSRFLAAGDRRAHERAIELLAGR